MTKIDKTAHIDPHAEIAEDVEIGHNCYLGPDVKIGPKCVLYNNVTVIGKTTIGEGNVFFPNAVIGAVPQDLKYEGGDTELIIGDNNTFRENVTAHLGTELGGGKTVIGNNDLFMAGVHIAHDCYIADHVIIANNAMIGGHVTLETHSVIGGGAGLHHFVTVARFAMVGGLTRVVCDVPPFMVFEGNPGAVRGVNVVGLSRNGFDADQIETVKYAYRKLFRSGNLIPALDELDQTNGDDPNMRYLIDFIRRSFQGRHGRFRESMRSDGPGELARLYKSDNADTDRGT